MSEWTLIVAILAGAIVYLHAIIDLPKVGMTDVVGPQFFPYLVCGGLFVSGFLLIVETVGKRMRLSSLASKDPGTADPVRVHLVLLGVFLWTALYYALFEPLGYLVATPIYVFTLLFYFYKTQWWLNLIYAVAFTLTAYFVFSRMLNVALPAGILSN